MPRPPLFANAIVLLPFGWPHSLLPPTQLYVHPVSVMTRQIPALTSYPESGSGLFVYWLEVTLLQTEFPDFQNYRTRNFP